MSRIQRLSAPPTPPRQSPTPESPDALARFGARDGLPLRNKDQIMDQVWERLGRKPKVLYGLCERGSPYGHAFMAVERMNPTSGKVELMVDNIVGARGSRMVQSLSLTEYLFGVNDFEGASRQRGAYNRPFVLFALHGENLKPEAATAYFDDLAKRNERGEARFSLLLSRVFNVAKSHPRIDAFTPSGEYGNCARYSSEGMKAASAFERKPGLKGHFSHNTIWPKRIGIRLLEGRSSVQPDQIDVVAVPWISHAVKTSRAQATGVTYVNPLTRLGGALGLRTRRGAKFGNLADHAAVTVDVPAGSMTAQVLQGPSSLRS